LKVFKKVFKGSSKPFQNPLKGLLEALHRASKLPFKCLQKETKRFIVDFSKTLPGSSRAL